jgi:hypothetical protein
MEIVEGQLLRSLRRSVELGLAYRDLGRGGLPKSITQEHLEDIIT